MKNKFLDTNNYLLQLKLEKVAIAVSGGADSLCLTFLLKELFKNYNTQIYTFTVDHCLRESSTIEALHNKKLLNSYGINNEILTWEHKFNINSNIQSKAREARYDLLINKCQGLGIKYLFLGHNQDDVAENFLIRLRRGSGLDGLAAIKKTIKIANINIIRPLLHFTKIEIKNYLQEQNIEWFEDPSNKNMAFERVKVRNFLCEEELLSKRIACASKHLRMVKDYVDVKIKEIESEVTTYDPHFHVVKIELKKFLELSDYEKFTIISNSLQLIGDKIYKPRFSRLSEIIKDIEKNVLKNFNLHSCLITIFKKNFIIVCREANNNVLPLNQRKLLWQNFYEIVINNFELNQGLSLSFIGEKGWQNHSIKNLISEVNMQNYPKIVFYALPVIKRLEKIVSIPHLNYYSEESYKEIKIIRVK